MSKKYFSITFATVVAVCAMTFSGLTYREDPRSQDAAPTVQLRTDPPEHVRYMVLFRHLNQLRSQAEKQEHLGKDGSGYQRRFKNALAVGNYQFDKLNEIALQCDSEVAELDKKAEAIIKAFWRQYPPGTVPEGVVIPPPPAELIALQEARKAAILRARDQVKAVLGDEEFARLDETFKRRLTLQR